MLQQAFVWLPAVVKPTRYLPPPENTSVIETRFFSSHRTGHPAEKALVDFIRRKNEKEHFVAQTVKQIGYPRWDKMVTTASKSKMTGRDASDSSLATYYLPFVRDSQNFVNASMVIKTYPADTTFSYKCDWQYAQTQNNTYSVSDSSEYLAIFFMVLDQHVFGHTKFHITDTTIFKHTSQKPLYVTLDSATISGRNSLLTPVEVCQDVTIYVTDCAYPGYPECTPTCDGCWECTSSISNTYCWTEWIDAGGGSAGSGTGGGGSGSGGGSTPPDCDPGPVQGNRLQINETCEPGWEPVPEEEDPPTEDPCTLAHNAAKKMDSAYIKSHSDSVLATIPDLATGLLEKGFPIYKKFRVNPYNVTDTTITTYRCGNVQVGTDSGILIQLSPGYLELSAATLHTHPPKGYSAPSARDIYGLIEESLADPHYEGVFVAAANGSQYAITITDPARAAAFLNTKNIFLNKEYWNENSVIGKAFKDAENYFKTKIFKSNPNKNNLAYEMAMAAVIKQFDIGISLSKRDASGNFKPLVLKTIIPNPNKPKKKVYQQDCI